MCFVITVCFVFVSHADEINSQRSSGGVVEMFWVFFFFSRLRFFFFDGRSGDIDLPESGSIAGY